tara:strand:- start:6290 stop:7039 length:750 start_codon:yes stop_codon:yes gene_type:complete
MAKNALKVRPIAVLIDAENVSQPKLMFGLLQELSKCGTVGLKRVYGNAAAVAKWKDEASEFGIEVGLKSLNPKRKNASDFSLIIDAMDLMHSGKYGGFCIVSSDSDFLPLVQRIRREGISVYNCGEDEKTTTSRNAYSRFFAVEHMLKPVVRPKADAIAKKVVKPALARGSIKPTQDVLDKFCTVVAAAGGRSQKITLVSLGQRLGKDYESFSAKKYGHAGLGKFLLAHDELFVCDKKDGKGVSHVKLR